MPDFTKAGYQGTWIPLRRINGDYGLTIILKRRYEVDMASADCVPAEDQPPIQLVQEFRDPENAATSDVLVGGEMCPEKERCDLIVKATAYAPGGKPATEFEVSLRFGGGFERTLRVIGNRVARFVEPKKRLTKKQVAAGEQQEYPIPEFSEPKPFVKLPLTYHFAFGGVGAIVMEADVAEVAAEFQEEAKLLEERNQRKKEIEQELIAEAEAEKEAEKAAKTSSPATTDEEAAEKADEAFAGPGGTQFLSREALEGLEAEDQEPEMKKVSEYRLGKDLPDRPDQLEPPAEEATDAGEEDDEAEEEPAASGTQILDISELDDVHDEYQDALDDAQAKRARKLKDREGALRVRATKFGDIELTDDEWIDEHGKRPEEAPEPEPEPSEYPEVPYPANPIGRGFCVSPKQEAVEGLKLPNIEWSDDLLQPEDLVQDLETFDLDELTAPAGFAAYPLSWFPRAGLAGVFEWDLDEAEAAKLKALDEYDPEDPEDQEVIASIKEQEIPLMQAGFYQEAHPRMQVERVNGNEDVFIRNLTPDGNLFFRLPGAHPKVTIERPLHSDLVPIGLDMLTIDLEEPEKPAVELVWRGWYALRDFDQIDELAPFDVDVDQVTQDAWFELQSGFEADKKRPRKEGTQIFQAMPDEPPEDEDSDEVDARYKKWVARRKAQKAEAVGEPKKEDGTMIFDQSRNLQLNEDEWDEEIRADKETFLKEAAERQAAEEKEQLKDIRAKASEQADEEFGIEREAPDEDEEEEE